jgi:tight adherence protein C
MMAILPWLIPLFAAMAAGVGLLWLLHLIIESSTRVEALGDRDDTPSDPLPRWVSLPVAVFSPLADWLGPRVPVAVRGTVQEQLKRAGLDEALTPPQLLMLAGLLMFLCGGAAAVLGVPGALIPVLTAVGCALPWLWLRERVAARRDEVIRELPMYVDMLTLALEAGGSLSVALRVATERSADSVLRRAFVRVQGDLRAGRSRAEALRALGERLDMPAINPLVAALVQADASGGSLAEVLRTQSEQRLNERFARAEKRAMEAPVRMLAPLVLCIFPCTFLILAFPIVMRFFTG